MPGLLPDVDPDGLLEYSVVYTDRSLNHMSKSFQGVMRGLSALLKKVYHAQAVAISLQKRSIAAMESSIASSMLMSMTWAPLSTC